MAGITGTLKAVKRARSKATAVNPGECTTAGIPVSRPYSHYFLWFAQPPAAV